MVTLAPGVAELTLRPDERDDLRALLDGVARDHARADDPAFLARLPELRERLPERIRAVLQAMKDRQDIAALVIRGAPLPEPAAPTPAHWRERAVDASSGHDFWLALTAGQVGWPVCWSTLQDGRLFQDVLPIAGEEKQQTGHGSHSELSFHVEDCFSDDRCDVLTLLCVRNPDRIPTTVATAAALDPAGLDLETLTGPHFRILPDPEHLRGRDPASVDSSPRAVLSTEGSVLRLRVDPAFCEPVGARAAQALGVLHEQLDAGLFQVPLDPGDLLMVDNRRAVHGRSAFRPRYDGTDRWLRKLTVTADEKLGAAQVVEPFPEPAAAP
jgi:L-asparagine oxygenase